MCFSISGFLSVCADEQSQEKHKFLEERLLHVTKDGIQAFLNAIEIPNDLNLGIFNNLGISLDELKTYSLNDDDVRIINKEMIDFIYLPLQHCQNTSNTQCYFDVLGQVFNDYLIKIKKRDMPSQEKKQAFCILLLIYTLAHGLFNSVLSQWED
jgi:hypothetical protein